MLLSKKNRQIIDCQDSYYFRKQQKKRRYKWLKLSALAFIITLLALFFAPFALSNPVNSNKANINESATRDNALISGPQLIFDHPHPAMRATLPIDIEANIEINGLVAYAEIKQTFINPHAIALEGKYQFPLPENSAVKHLMIKVGDTEIIGEIMEKKAAKAVYQQAKRQGKKASLVEQHRPNLFTNKIANIPAQSTVVVTLKFIMPVTFSHGDFNLRLPLAMTQRYQPNAVNQPENNQATNSEKIDRESPRTPNSFEHNPSALYSQSPQRIQQADQAFKQQLKHQLNHQLKHPFMHMAKNSGVQSNSNLPEPFSMADNSSAYVGNRAVAKSQSSINIALNSGIPISTIASNSHVIKTRALNSEQNAYLITLNKTQVVSDKSFDLRWKLLASDKPQVSSFSQEVAGEHYTLLTFFPPESAKAEVIARDIIFIVDTSGSMQGGSMAQAKASLQLAILQLNAKDSFNIIAFDNETELLFSNTKMASKQHISDAQHFIERLSADGGTQMYQPLSNALMMKKAAKQSAKALRQIVFITDGAVANEFELMQLLNHSQDSLKGTVHGDFRLYTVGIGAAPNGYFMKKAAQFGRGSYVFIQNQNEVQQKMTHFMTKISQPAISNINLVLDSQVHQLVEVYPKKIPDLYFGEPLQVALKSDFPITSVQLTGETASADWYQQLIVNDGTTLTGSSSKGISSLWARRKIESLVDSLVVGANRELVKSEVIATSLTHQIISPYTSFIAVEKQVDFSSLKGKDALKNNKAIQAHESLMVAMPQTALGWQLQFLVGIALLLFANLSRIAELGNKRLKLLGISSNCCSGFGEKHD